MSKRDDPISQADPAEYRKLELHAHTLLAGVPLHDVWTLDLPGGGPDRTVRDVQKLMSMEKIAEANRAVAILFRLRVWLGAIFRLDDSKAKPGAARETPEDPFDVIFTSPVEVISEIRNATVHAFSVYVLEPQPGGYRFYWAIYVEPVGRITAFYMALIDPFRHRFVYPAALRYLERAWSQPVT